MTLHLLQYSDVENAFDEPERVARLAGGLAARRAAIKTNDGSDTNEPHDTADATHTNEPHDTADATHTNANTELNGAPDEIVLVVGTGDVFGPGVLALESHGSHAMDFFDAVSPIAETLGNHDFDHGADRARELVATAPHEFLVANAFETDAAGEPTEERFGGAHTAPSTIVEVGGVRVGFVGVASPETATMATGAESVAFLDPLPLVRDELAVLRDAGVDHTVVLGHLGERDGEALAAAVDADLVLDGHRHQPFAATFDGTGYARPGNGARHFVHATLPTTPTDSWTTPDPPTDGRAFDPAAWTPAATGQGTVDAASIELVETATAPIHEELLAALQERFETAGLDAVVATVDDPIDCSKAAADRGESRVGNLVTDAYRWAADADVAVMSPGGIRTRDDLTGGVTKGDLVGLVPFDNTLLTCEVDGDTLRDVLASTTLYRLHENPSRKMGHYAGATVVWDDVDERLRSVTVDGEPIDPDATYRLAATTYFVQTNHIYPTLQPEHVVARHGPQYDHVVEYVRQLEADDPTALDPPIEGRVERPTLDAVATPASE